MAWLSLITHASLLSFLRNYLVNHPRQLWWRFGAMLLILAMFIVAIALTHNFTWYFSKKPSHFANCPPPADVDQEDSSGSAQSKAKLLFFVIYGFVVRILKLFPAVDRAPRRISFWFRQMSMRIEHGHDGRPGWDPRKKCDGWKDTLHVLLQPLKIALFGILQLHIDILTSFLAEVRESVNLPFLF